MPAHTDDMELFTNWHTWQRTEPELRHLLPAATCDAVAQAVAFALRFHGDQKRPTGAPYAEHLLEALEVLVRGAGVSDPDVL
jgi:(p)ppGpp synthase/HD superfamily hydrolase